MASSMQYYTVSITNSYSNTSPKDGFIDHQRIENYYAGTAYALETTPSGLTLAVSTAKRRGNVRYQEIIRQMELISNCWIDPNTLTASGGTALLEPTSFVFKMVGQAGDSAWVTADENNAGQTLTSTACIKRCIARALIADMYRVIDVFDPTPTTAPGNNTANVIRFGTRINVASSLEIGAYASSIANAEAVISVSLLH